MEEKRENNVSNNLTASDISRSEKPNTLWWKKKPAALQRNINLGNKLNIKQGDCIADVGGDVIKDVGGDVIKDVGGDVFKDVQIGGDFFKDLHVHGDFFYGEMKIRLPRFVALKAKYNGKYLRLTKNEDGVFRAGFLKFEGTEVGIPQGKFELEAAKCGHELVNIRCCDNNKYLVRSGTSNWIVAAADKPEENKSKISCTLFELEPVNKSGGLEFRFRHIQMGMYACLWKCSKRDGILFHGGLYGVKKKNKAVVLPRFMALKAMYNSKYLSLIATYDPVLPVGFLKFDEEEVVNLLVKFEVEMAKSGTGLVHIRCCYNNKYLVRDNPTINTCCYNNKYWIVAAADKPEEDKYKISCTLFEPEPYDESGELEFRFRHVQLGTYACLWRMRNHIPFYGGLYTGSNVPDKDACDVFTVVNLNRCG
ncbi:hypothetical protein M0R45_006131 [Rubus argutus]|uniref:Agglutinin domain-containing protein n=1 Tax=Rubus argutus TaxID=59490 RepID=A0AAW1YPX7_RUBAR